MDAETWRNGKGQAQIDGDKTDEREKRKGTGTDRWGRDR